MELTSRKLEMLAVLLVFVLIVVVICAVFFFSEPAPKFKVGEEVRAQAGIFSRSKGKVIEVTRKHGQRWYLVRFGPMPGGRGIEFTEDELISEEEYQRAKDLEFEELDRRYKETREKIRKQREKERKKEEGTEDGRPELVPSPSYYE